MLSQWKTLICKLSDDMGWRNHPAISHLQCPQGVIESLGEVQGSSLYFYI